MGRETIRMRYRELFQYMRQKTHAKHVIMRRISRRIKKHLFVLFLSGGKLGMQKGHVMMAQ